MNYTDRFTKEKARILAEEELVPMVLKAHRKGQIFLWEEDIQKKLEVFERRKVNKVVKIANEILTDYGKKIYLKTKPVLSRGRAGGKQDYIRAIQSTSVALYDTLGEEIQSVNGATYKSIEIVENFPFESLSQKDKDFGWIQLERFYNRKTKFGKQLNQMKFKTIATRRLIGY